MKKIVGLSMLFLSLSAQANSIQTTIMKNSYFPLAGKNFNSTIHTIHGISMAGKNHKRLSVVANLEFINYDPLTDSYRAKITFKKGAWLECSNLEVSCTSKFLSNAQAKFISSRDSEMMVSGKIVKEDLKTNDFGTPVIADELDPNPINLKLTPDLNSLVLGINHDIPVNIDL